MNKYIVRAYANCEYGLKEQNTIIYAETLEDAKIKAWNEFPEYREIGVWEKEGAE